MMNKLIFVLAGPAMLGLLTILAAQNDAPKIVVPPVGISQDDQFDDAWRDATVPIALKSASLAITEPKPIWVETISVMPEVVVMEEEKPQIKRKHVDDVCSRHGMHKVYRHKGWRCRK